MLKSRTYIATPPGATIKEQLEDRSMSQKEFAARMDMSEKHISHLINGDVLLTADVAYRLEMVLGLPARFWSNLESIYREKLVKAKAENELDKDIELAKKFPYAEMAKNGWLPETKQPEERVTNLRKFFEVVQLSRLENAALIPAIACRRLSITEKSDFALLAWAQKAKLDAREIETEPINLKQLECQLNAIRDMTAKEPAAFSNELRALLARCGIALVFLPHFNGSFLYGATFCDKNKIVVGMTLRGKDADKFWFSLFHELGHIVLGHLHQSAELDRVAEDAADKFAADILIPPDSYSAFTQAGSFAREAIVKFSQELRIDPGIVVGRLQKEGYIDFSRYNDLKTKYERIA